MTLHEKFILLTFPVTSIPVLLFYRVNIRKKIYTLLYKTDLSWPVFLLRKENAEKSSILAESEIGDGVDSREMSLFSYSSPLCTGCWMQPHRVTGGLGWNPPVRLTAVWKVERWRTSPNCPRALTPPNTSSTYSCGQEKQLARSMK